MESSTRPAGDPVPIEGARVPERWRKPRTEARRAGDAKHRDSVRSPRDSGLCSEPVGDGSQEAPTLLGAPRPAPSADIAVSEDADDPRGNIESHPDEGGHDCILIRGAEEIVMPSSLLSRDDSSGDSSSRPLVLRDVGEMSIPCASGAGRPPAPAVGYGMYKTGHNTQQQSVPTGTVTKVTWNVTNDGPNWTTSGFAAPSAGVYRICATVDWFFNNVNERWLAIAVGGVYRRVVQNHASNGSNSWSQVINHLEDEVDQDDLIEFYVWQDSGSLLNLRGETTFDGYTVQRTYFSIQRTD